MQRARVFYLDPDRRILKTCEITFGSRADLMRQLEPDLDRCGMIEAWQGDDCVLCATALGAIELRCGKPTRPAARRCW